MVHRFIAVALDNEHNELISEATDSYERALDRAKWYVTCGFRGRVWDTRQCRIIIDRNPWREDPNT